MICVSIGRSRVKNVVQEHKTLAEAGAELVELRLDWLSGPPDLAMLLNDRPTPTIVTFRRPQDQGKWHGTESERQNLLRAAIVAGTDFIDIEDDIADKIKRYGTTRRIISHHNFNETPDDLEQIHERMTKLDPDVIKIISTANSPEDCVRMLRLVSDATVPTVGFCMGEFGTITRILCGKYGSPFTYASFSSERELAPGQLSFQQMKDLYRYDDINTETRVFAVIGDPIAQSLSPLIHNSAFQHEKINAVYIPLRVPRHQFYSALEAYKQLHIEGYSVTIPHKESAIKTVHFTDDSVKQCGAANTLYHREKGAWYAINTDMEAALTSIRLGLKQADGSHDHLEGKRVLLLGAGGVARAIAYGLQKAGAVITVTNHNKVKAEELAKQLGCQFVTWENRGTDFFDILVNCTPVGMYPEVNDTPFPAHWLRDNMLVFDTIYKPESTLLIKQARERGCRTVSGLEMFVRQATAQFECFTEQEAPIDVMRNAIRQGISPVKSANRIS
jgi:3-dehydroquinate dehydratase/shikimate dehydrogenase